MLTPHRRHRKASPKPNIQRDSPTPPQQQQQQQQQHADSSSSGGGGGGGGLYSYFATARRRWSRSHKEADTLLPTTYSSYSYSSPKRSSLAPTAKNCNSFLMGGHYYPGKDKKRRHMRKKTLWYKMFCSSTWRKLSSFFIVLYVVVWHGLVPLGGWLLQVVGTTSMNGAGMGGAGAGDARSAASIKTNWLQYDSTLVVPKLREEQADRLQIDSERARLQFGSLQRKALRNKLLEEIAPVWYHRNSNTNTNKQQPEVQVLPPPPPPQEDTKKTKKKAKSTATRKKPSKKHETTKSNNIEQPLDDGTRRDTDTTQNATKQQQLQQQPMMIIPKETTNSTTARALRMTGETLPIRTIHNMDAFATNHSSCASSSLSLEEWSTTLVVQTTVNRLWILNETCARWKDPIIAVVFVPKSSDEPKAADLLQVVTCPHVTIIQYMANDQESTSQGYPVNRLRNIGLDAVKTSHILVADVDFVPSLDLHETIRGALKHQHEAIVLQGEDADEDKQALIVPAFERQPPTPCETESACAAYLQSNSSFIPKSFADLQPCFLSNECTVFQRKVNWEGHYSTNSEEWIQRKWYSDEEQTLFRTIPCFHTARYEPYVVLRWCGNHQKQQQQQQPVAPYYDERFHGYGKNKIELISHLRKSGYRFAILPEGFIVHNPHPESSVKETWNDKEGSTLHASMDSLYTDFLHELDTKYKTIHNSTVKLCQRQ